VASKYRLDDGGHHRGVVRLVARANGWCAVIPGRLLHRLARVLCAADFHHRVVEAQLADFQDEWASANGTAHRGAILTRGYGAFWCLLASWAATAFRREIGALSWRDAFPFPGVLAITIVSIMLAERWVRTGEISGVRFDGIDTRVMWAMVPLALVQRCWPTLRGVRGFAVYIGVFYVSALPLLRTDILRDQMRGWEPFMVLLLVLTLIQPRRSASRSG
jgi:hypothetical protein